MKLEPLKTVLSGPSRCYLWAFWSRPIHCYLLVSWSRPSQCYLWASLSRPSRCYLWAFWSGPIRCYLWASWSGPSRCCPPSRSSPPSQPTFWPSSSAFQFIYVSFVLFWITATNVQWRCQLGNSETPARDGIASDMWSFWEGKLLSNKLV